MKLNTVLAAAAFAATIAAGSARADSIPYPNYSTYNPITYTFTAAADGDVVAYIVGGFGAGFENELGLLINGISTGIFGLNNHTSSMGDSLVLGYASAGDTLTFVLRNISLGLNAYSDQTMNATYDDLPAGTNHVYSTAYTATNPIFGSVPVGIYVAFEDLPFGNSDFNYDDESFVFANTVATENPVPVPAALPLFAGGLGMIGLLARRRKRASR